MSQTHHMWLIHMWPIHMWRNAFKCDVTDSSVICFIRMWRASIICDVTHSYVAYSYVAHVQIDYRIRRAQRYYVSCVSFICDSFICDAFVCDVTHSYVTRSYVTCLVCMWHASFVCNSLICATHAQTDYGLATIIRLLKIIGLFCRI